MITKLELFEKKIELDLKKLESELEIFRKKEEDENDWQDDKTCFKGTCQDITKYLEEYLKKLGYDAVRTGGYYYNVDDYYSPDMSEWDWDEEEEYLKYREKNYDSACGLPHKHWWVEIGKYIIDVTEDQFHPGEEDEYRIGIYKKPDVNYSYKWKKHN